VEYKGTAITDPDNAKYLDITLGRCTVISKGRAQSIEKMLKHERYMQRSFYCQLRINASQEREYAVKDIDF